MATFSSWWQQYLRSRYEKIEFYDIIAPIPNASDDLNLYNITKKTTPIIFSSKRSAYVDFLWTAGMWEIFVDCLRETSIRGYVLVVDVSPHKDDPNIIGDDWKAYQFFDTYFRYFDINDNGLSWLKNFMDNINFSCDYICYGGIIKEFPLDIYYKENTNTWKSENSLDCFINKHSECIGVQFCIYDIMCRPFPRIQEVLLDKLEQIRLRKLGLLDP